MRAGIVGVMVAVSLSAPARAGEAPRAGTPLLTAAEDTSLRALYADADGVYVAGTRRAADGGRRGFIERVSPGSGAATVLWEDADAPYLIRSNKGDLVFAAAGNPDDRTTILRRLSKQGGPATELATFSGHARLGNVVLTETSAYYTVGMDNTTGGRGDIGQISLANGTRRLVAAAVPVGPLAISGGYLYWIGRRELRRISLSGGEATSLWTSSGPALRDIAAGASGDVYLLSDEGITRFRDGAAVDFASSLKMPRHVLADGSSVYWAATGGPLAPTLMRAGVANGAPAAFASGRSMAALAQDQRRIYWLDPAAHEVSFAAKP